MSKAQFIVREGSLQEKFLSSRKKVQFYGGGYGNGKTSCACVKAIQLMKDYPGSNGAVLRSTLPKLKSTTMKEFFKWLPQNWVQSFSNTERVLTLKNGSQCTFTYVGQQGKENGTSNLLSATFDWVVVDQFEDPEFVYKDFTDLLGRLRGTAEYAGDDPTMPKTGPRWLIFLSNPTRNWVYQNIIRPIKLFEATGVRSDLLLYDKGKFERTGEVDLIIDIIEGSTYENKDNLPEDFIQTLENTYSGQMKDRFLKGEWAGYEGLVYPDFDMACHVVSEYDMKEKFDDVRRNYDCKILEGFDYGLAAPACYLLGFTDGAGNVHIMDGWYKNELTLDEQVNAIRKVREVHGIGVRNFINADPAIFKRSAGPTIADQMFKLGAMMVAADNNILSGIEKVNSYIARQKMHKHAYNGDWSGPKLYVNEKLGFFIDEISGYYWMKDITGSVYEDRPTDKNDHAMDCMKYMLTNMPVAATITQNTHDSLEQRLSRWYEAPEKKTNENWRV